MKTQKPFLLLSSLLAVIFLAGVNIYAQTDAAKTQVPPSYEVVLQVLVGSNDAGDGTGLSPNLRPVYAQLKTNFGFSSYRLDNTFIGRIGTNGTFEYKSVSNTVGAGADSESPTFLEWTLGGLKNAMNDKGQTAFQAEPFRFGARVPVRVSTYTDNTGKAVGNVSYESIGLTVNRVSLLENTPTLIGTLSLPKTAGTIFLILTVRSAQ